MRSTQAKKQCRTTENPQIADYGQYVKHTSTKLELPFCIFRELFLYYSTSPQVNKSTSLQVERQAAVSKQLTNIFGGTVTTIDYIVIGVLLFSTIKGFFRGLIVEVLSIVGLIGGLYLASRFYPSLQSLGIAIGIPSAVARIIAYILILCLVTGAAAWLGSILTKIAKKLFMGWLNRLAGAIFGFIEGALVIIILLVVVSLTPWKDKVEVWRKESKAVKIMLQAADPFIKQFENKKLDIFQSI